jgi:hypothetical protein
MNQLQDFVARVLTQAGAVVETIDPEGLEVLAPPPVQSALGLPEWTRLGFGPALPAGAERVRLDSDVLARLGGLLGERGSHVRRAILPDAPAPSAPARILEHTLELTNATYRLETVTPAWTCYTLLRFHFTAISDEKRDGLLDVGCNLATGATPDDFLPELLAGAAALAPLPAPPLASQLPTPWTPARWQTVLARALPPRVHAHLDAFTRGMRRRQARDLDRLFAYHHDLQREAAARLAALATRALSPDKRAADEERERLRLTAIARDYQAKVIDVRDKYAMTVDLTWLQTLELIMPVQRFAVRVRRRKGERLLHLDWNPLVRKLEPAPCEFSFTPARPRAVCDDALHLVTPTALDPCPACGKAYCRACRPERCPKCGQGPAA